MQNDRTHDILLQRLRKWGVSKEAGSFATLMLEAADIIEALTLPSIAALSRATEAVTVFETTPGSDESWVKDQFLATPPKALEARAWECDKWPDWLHAVVDRANNTADRLDMSSEQAMAYAVLTALSEQGEAAQPAADWRTILRKGFMTCVSSRPDYYVKVQFKTLKEAQDFHRALIASQAEEGMRGMISVEFPKDGLSYETSKRLCDLIESQASEIAALRQRLAEVERENKTTFLDLSTAMLEAAVERDKWKARAKAAEEANKRLRAETIEECAKVADNWGSECAATIRSLADAHTGKQGETG